ncbi:peptide chain release factor 1 [Oenococcus sicerae]|uniref:Peptide chain release factor 1 n=1 Tax=Oenococcus sicerae TaxID=2203724 RepID=A0AAJ1RD53_9LACO|nr:peptide chain release factor 1 [Oenococcus sicerae]MDN6900567.1 peptide chain release factor 1 [Oenococcus sicerae]QAS69417.1 peptide chain release factor 1 [Oenococcus sicerae]
MDKIFAQIQNVVDRFDELNELLADPDVISDSNKYTEYAKELGAITPTVEVYRQYEHITAQIVEDKGLLADKEMADLAKTELAALEPQQTVLSEKLKILMIPKDPNDDKNIIMEIRGAVGGDEANLFAGDLLSMYAHYAQSQNWHFEIVDDTPGEAGGFKEVVVNISGENVYSKLKFESGAHRVQRVPVTETQGRVHTSTATVGVMPEFEDVDTEGLIDPKDVREDVYRSSGAGGQHINKTSSAVRLVHLPTGIKVEMQEQRSQQQNRAKAWQILRSRVYDHFAQENRDEYDEQRRSKIGSGDRSERIRTYNFPQNRVTDHRINFTLNKLDRVINGDLEEIIDALIIADQAKRLEAMI